MFCGAATRGGWWWRVFLCSLVWQTFCLKTSFPFEVIRLLGGGRGGQRQSAKNDYFWKHERFSGQTALHGIKGFRQFFGSAFPSAVTEIKIRKEPCDHLLIDVNQLLHVAVRKGGYGEDRWERSLVRLMSDLDGIIKFFKPRKSVVLAMDGPPPAAKLATQRKRRQTTLDRTEAQIALFERISKDKKKMKNSKRLVDVMNRKKKHWRRAIDTLVITPGTDFMDKAASSILYWAWQRLQGRHGSLHHLQILVSSSHIHGEGEVKLLEFLYRPESAIRTQDKVVLLGGDSDLVLQGLMVPPHVAHSVDVSMPNQGSYISVRIADVVESLKRDYMPHLKNHNVMRIRTDIVFLFILSGNDYLPKLRGGSGFSSFFHLYTGLNREWHKLGLADEAYLVDPDSLQFNRKFALEYFEQLSQLHKDRVPTFQNSSVLSIDRNHLPALSRLNNLRDTGIIPQEIRFEVIEDEIPVVDKKSKLKPGSNRPNNGFTDDDQGKDTHRLEKQVLVRLHVGTPGTSEYDLYELKHTITHPKSESLQRARHALAAMALDDFYGGESDDFNDGDSGEGDPFEVSDTGGSTWEEFAKADVEKYLYGLLWNIQMYRDGVCSDYGYNYGKRVAPTSDEIYHFLKKDTPIRLFEADRVGPMTAGLSCLAALPLKVREFLPEPFSFLSNETIEEVYSACVNEDDSSFDLEKFSSLCTARLQSYHVPKLNEAKTEADRCVRCSERGWTVLSKKATHSPHFWNPPKPGLSRLGDLQKDKRIWVSEWTSLDHTQSQRRGPLSRVGFRGLDGIDRTALQSRDVPEQIQSTGVSTLASSRENGTGSFPEENRVWSEAWESVRNHRDDIPLVSLDGLDAFGVLRRLQDLGLVFKWSSQRSNSSSLEVVTLIVYSYPGLLDRDLVIKRGRVVYSKSRKHLLRKQMASAALTEINQDWYKFSCEQLRQLLRDRISSSQVSTQTQPELGFNASAYR